MARPKKTTARKATAKKATRATAAKASAKPQSNDAIIKMLKGATSEKRPPNNPNVPQNIIDNLNQDFNSIKELLDNFSQHLRALDRCRKAKGFSARSLRYAQTPHIKKYSVRLQK